MKDTDWGWISKQLAAADSSKEVSEAVVYVLEVLRKQELDDDAENEVLSKALALAANHSIIPEVEYEHWGPVIPGAYSIGDTVRVRANAFEGEKGRANNGKRGRVTAARDGFVRVLLEDSPSIDIQMHYRPELLERLS